MGVMKRRKKNPPKIERCCLFVLLRRAEGCADEFYERGGRCVRMGEGEK